jgi:hypothetical protein
MLQKLLLAGFPSVAAEKRRVIKARFTGSENRELLEHSPVFRTLNSLVDETSRLVRHENNEEQESELVHHVFVHDTVIDRFGADRSDEHQGEITRVLLTLAESHCAVQTA